MSLNKFHDAVVALVAAAEEAEIGEVESIHVDVQASGELPYRVVIADDEWPFVGLARVPASR